MYGAGSWISGPPLMDVSWTLLLIHKGICHLSHKQTFYLFIYFLKWKNHNIFFSKLLASFFSNQTVPILMLFISHSVW